MDGGMPMLNEAQAAADQYQASRLRNGNGEDLDEVVVFEAFHVAAAAEAPLKSRQHPPAPQPSAGRGPVWNIYTNEVYNGR